jgi:nicotinamidase/pyrazinamidase
MSKKIVVASGYFDPMHAGHIEYLQQSKDLGDTLIVIVNNDRQATLKKGKSFMPCAERVKMVRALECVDAAIESIDEDRTVCRTLGILHPHIFTNGGDQFNDNIPEAKVCRELGIDLVDSLGNKIQSSSWLVRQASGLDVSALREAKAAEIENAKARKTALLIIDVQNDFCPPIGALAVGNGTDVIPVINDLRAKKKWGLVVCSKDWHPSNHCSFVNNNEGATIFTEHKLPSGQMQMMWPAHCLQNSPGSEFHPDLVTADTDKVVFKGKDVNQDSYSAFYDNNHTNPSGLTDMLRANGITHVVCTGLAYDYCVGFSALDAKADGFDVTFVEDAARGVAPESTVAMRRKLLDAGVKLVNSDAL